MAASDATLKALHAVLAEQLSRGAKTLSQADTSGGNALSAILGNPQ